MHSALKIHVGCILAGNLNLTVCEIVFSNKQHESTQLDMKPYTCFIWGSMSLHKTVEQKSDLLKWVCNKKNQCKNIMERISTLEVCASAIFKELQRKN